MVQPQSVSVTEGNSAQFGVQFVGTTPIQFRWQRNGVDIPGATGTSYVTPPLTLADSGAVYRVIISNNLGQITSSGAAVTVTPAVPLFTSNPAPLALVAGQTANFSVTVTSSSPVTLQWLRDGTPIPGAVSNTFSFVTTLGDNNARISVIATNAVGSTTSPEALLRVTSTAIAPAIISQPSDVTVRAGQSAQFFVTASGSGPITYQWLRNGVDMPGAQIVSPNALPVNLTLQVATLADDGARFSVRVTNSAGTVTSGEARLGVQP